MKKAPLVQIQIVNYNSWPMTMRCIQAMKRQSYSNYRIVVIDNNSTNDSLEKLKSCDDIILIQSKKNLGWGGGHNLGFFNSIEPTPDYFLTVNSDAILDTKCLKILVDTLEKHQECAIASPMIYKDYTKKKIDNVAYNLSYRFLFPIDLSRFTNNHSHHIKKGIRYVNWTDDVVALMRRGPILEIGGYDEEYFMYVEMTDMAYRLLRKGYIFVVNYEAIAYHKGKGSSGNSLSDFSIYYKLRNWLRFQRKFFPKYHLPYTIIWIITIYAIYNFILMFNLRFKELFRLNQRIFQTTISLRNNDK